MNYDYYDNDHKGMYNDLKKAYTGKLCNLAKKVHEANHQQR